MNYRKFKSYSLLSSFILSSLILLSWSQTWFVFTVTFSSQNDSGLEVPGQIAASSLSAFGLAGFALTAALSISSIVMRRVLAFVIILLGVFVTFVSVTSLSDPVLASSRLLTSLSAISDVDSLRTFVISSSSTPWPGISAVIGVLFVMLGIVVFFTAGKWSTGSRKFDLVAKSTSASDTSAPAEMTVGQINDVSSSNIDAWDSLSHGSDPTIN